MQMSFDLNCFFGIKMMKVICGIFAENMHSDFDCLWKYVLHQWGPDTQNLKLCVTFVFCQKNQQDDFYAKWLRFKCQMNFCFMVIVQSIHSILDQFISHLITAHYTSPCYSSKESYWSIMALSYPLGYYL